MSAKTKLKQLRIYLFLIFIVVVTALIQGSPVGTGFSVALRTCMLIPLTVCIGMFEKELSGALFGTFAGMLWDSFSSGADGVRAVCLMLIGCACGLLIRYFMRNNLLTAFVLSVSASFIYTVISWVFGVLAVSTNGAISVLLIRYLPGFLFSAAILPIFYFIIRTAEKSFRYSFSENGGIRRE